MSFAACFALKSEFEKNGVRAIHQRSIKDREAFQGLLFFKLDNRLVRLYFVQFVIVYG